MPVTAAMENFVVGLDLPARHELVQRLKQARQVPDADWVVWRCGEHLMGPISRDRAAWLADRLGSSSIRDGALVWGAGDWLEHTRSDALMDVLLAAKREGLLTGWRGERFSFWDQACTMPDLRRPPFLAIERAGFRFLGLVSHASHVNGFTENGYLWCGRRSLRKAVDPGCLDNFAAGGVAAGETPDTCVMRELFEEAGFRVASTQSIPSTGWIRISEPQAAGWHDEVLHVFNVVVGQDFRPVNQDGEVDEFLLLSPRDVMEHIRADRFTSDAVLALATGLHPLLMSGI
jgi:8-oxo-dGTP pyrophosphatase MutT (NUDIX family)